MTDKFLADEVMPDIENKVSIENFDYKLINCRKRLLSKERCYLMA